MSVLHEGPYAARSSLAVLCYQQSPTVATKWLGLVPNFFLSSAWTSVALQASISWFVRWLQWPHSRGCEDLLCGGTQHSARRGEAPFAPISNSPTSL